MSGLQPAHGKVIQDAVFDLLQVVVVGIEDFLGFQNVDFATGGLRPRQRRQPLHVVAGDGIIRRHRRHAGQPAQFFQRFFLDFIRHAGVFNLLLQFFGVARAFILLAQFFLDGLHLLAQVVLALRLLHPVLHFGLDLVAQLLDFELLRQMLVDFFQTHPDVGGFERVLLVGGRERRQRRGDEIHQPARLVDVHGDGRKFIRQSRRAGHDLLEQSKNVALQRFHLGALGRNGFRHRIHPTTHEGRQLREFSQPHPLQAFGKNKQALVGHLDDFVDDGEGSDGVEIAGLRGIDASFALRHHHDGLVFAQRINELNRALPTHGQGQHGMGEQHRIPHRQDRQNPSFFFFWLG